MNTVNDTQRQPMPRPIKDQVVIRQDPCQDRVGKLGILFAPQGEETWPNTGTVVSVGPEVKDVAAGERVMFQRKPDSALIPDHREGGPPEWKDLIIIPEGNVIGWIDE